MLKMTIMLLVGNLLKGLDNRYWLIENLLSPDFEKVRSFYYSYHREGLR